MMITNNGLAFYDELFHINFIQYFHLALCATWNLIIFNNDEITDVLAWPTIFAYVMKNVCIENLPLCKSYTSTKWNQHGVRLCIHYECSLSPLHASAQVLSCFGNLSTAYSTLAFRSRLRDELTRWFLLFVQALLVWLLPEKYWVGYYFRNLCHSWHIT